ncbi:protein of unknown function [Pararobbsia alpina]
MPVFRNGALQQHRCARLAEVSRAFANPEVTFLKHHRRALVRAAMFASMFAFAISKGPIRLGPAGVAHGSRSAMYLGKHVGIDVGDERRRRCLDC